MNLYATTADDEAFLLDLLNTTPVVDGVPTDTLADFSAARPWMTDRGIKATRAEWAALVDVRAALQGVVRAAESPASLEPFLTAASLVPVARDDGLDWRLSGNAAVRAVVAWDGLRTRSPGRLRPCANTECHLFLIDRSKPNSARWCSMAICGNRMKARRHYQRARS